MEYLIPAKCDILVLFSRNLVRIGMIDIIQLALVRPVDLHILREQRIKPQHRVLTVPDHLGVGVAPKEEVRHHSLPEGEAGHLRVGLTIEDFVERMVCRFLLPRVVVCLK